jgi:uracil-DNA glycosylase
MLDIPKSLSEKEEIENRLALIHNEHMEPLFMFVEKIRTVEKQTNEIPYFDPLDGGVNSTCLFLLEAPGPNAVKSNFISRNNPDETAKNLFEILKEIEIPRENTLIWNIVPWYIGNGDRIRPANIDDINRGWTYLVELLDILVNLKVIVLVGLKSQKIHSKLNKLKPEIVLVNSFHPSPLFINKKRQNRDVLLGQFREIKKYI